MTAPTAAGADAHFGQFWHQQIAGSITAQPVRVGPMLVVATNANAVYGLGADTGTVLWQQRLGRPEPAGVHGPIDCANLAPELGVLSTPVADPTTGSVYIASREWDGKDAASAMWRLHALNAANGEERLGWPVSVSGTAANAPAIRFDPVHGLQRAGLLFLDGQVVLAFAGICDQAPYRGWVVTVSTSTRAVSLWADEAAAESDGGGIWQSGRAPVSDRPHEFLIASGNGASPPVGPATLPADALANSLIRLRLTGDSVQAIDRFTPYQGDELNAKDLDFGAGAPALVPGSNGGKFVLQSSKLGYLYLLHAGDLGGRGQLRGRDAVVALAGPFEAAFGTPAFWPQSHYAYVMGTVAITAGQPAPRLRAFDLGSLGTPDLVQVGQSAAIVGYASSSPVVTSADIPSQTLVWAVVQPAGTEREPQLRAFAPTPDTRGTLAIRWTTPIVGASRFTPPLVTPEALYLGTGSGELLAFRYPGATPFAVDGPKPRTMPPAMLYGVVGVIAMLLGMSWVFLRTRRQHM